MKEVGDITCSCREALAAFSYPETNFDCPRAVLKEDPWPELKAEEILFLIHKL